MDRPEVAVDATLRPSEPPGLDAASFQAAVSCWDGHVLIDLFGDLDIAGLDVLAAAVTPLAGLRGLSVVVDASQLSFLDPGGLRGLAALNSSLRSEDGEMAILHPSPAVLRLLSLCGLSSWYGDAEPTAA